MDDEAVSRIVTVIVGGVVVLILGLVLAINWASNNGQATSQDSVLATIGACQTIPDSQRVGCLETAQAPNIVKACVASENSTDGNTGSGPTKVSDQQAQIEIDKCIVTAMQAKATASNEVGVKSGR